MRINNFTKLLILIPTFSVLAQKGLSINLDIKTEQIENGSINQMGIGTNFYKEIGTNNTIANAFKYESTKVTNEMESYLIQNYLTNLTGTQFNSFEDTFRFSYDLSQRTKLTLEVTPTANFESNFKISDITILGGIELNQKLSKNNSIDLGVKRMSVFGKPQILPTFSYNHQFNNSTNLQLGFPNSELAYSNSTRNKFSLNNDFSGSSYSLDSPILAEGIAISKCGFSQIETTLQYERNIDTSWFLVFKGGYSSNKEFKFSDENRTNEINQSIKNGSVFSVSVKYKL